jgi:hypothetical protein
MESSERINDEIYKLEQNLLSMIKEKVNLFDPEVILAGEKLDFALDKYSNLFR